MTKKHSELKIFPNRVPVELSRIAFPIMVLPEGDRTYSFREERLDLPYWTIILAIGASVDVSKFLDILIWDFLVMSVHLPPAHSGSLDRMSMTFAAVICDADEPCSVNTA